MVIWYVLTGLVGDTPGGFLAVRSSLDPRRCLRTQQAKASALTPPRLTSFYIKCKQVSIKAYEFYVWQVQAKQRQNTTKAKTTISYNVSYQQSRKPHLL